MSPKRPKLRVGDVFSVPVDDDRVGYGQIVSTSGSSDGQFYFAVFDGIHPRDEAPDLDAVLAKPLVLLAPSMDALLMHGHWRIVGHAQVDEGRIPWPAYKEGVSPPGSFDVVDARSGRRRSATPAEAERLPFRSVVAPIRVEKAFRALNGHEPWDESYEGLRPVDEEVTAAALLAGVSAS